MESPLRNHNNLVSLALVLALGLPSIAQTQPSGLSSWRPDLHNLTGSSPNPAVNGLISSIPADVQDIAYDQNYTYVTTRGMPSHPIGPFGPQPLFTPVNAPRTYRIPRNPQPWPAGQNPYTNFGPIAIGVNGAAIFNALDAQSYLGLGVWWRNAVIVEGPSLDQAYGHFAPQGIYHYHANPALLRDQIGDDGTRHSPIVGWAFDGYPIYGPYGWSDPAGTGVIRRMETGYQIRSITDRTVYPGGTPLAQQFWGPAVSAQFPLGYFVEDYEYVTGSGDLDAFNGRTAVTPEYPNGTYAYWVTIDQNGEPAYPYTVGPWFYGMSDPVNMNGGATVPAGAVPWAPTVQSTGAGCPTVAGGGFTVGANGEATLPNPTFSLEISNGPAGGQAWLYLASGIAVSPLSLGGGCNVWLDMASASILVGTGQSPFGPFGLDGAGSAILPVPLPAPPALVGQQIDIQGLGADPTNPGAIVTSNAFTLRFL